MPKNKCTFSPQLAARFKLFKPGRNPHEAECIICPAGTYVSVSHKGASDLETHAQSMKHQKRIKLYSETEDVASAFEQQSSNRVVHATSLAEATLVYCNVTHHVSYRAMDCAPKMLCKIFPNCDTAKYIRCARTKAEAIVNKVLGPHSVEAAVQSLGEVSCFGVSTDGSNHGNQKIFPVVIQFFNHKEGGLQAKLLELKSTPNENSETISSLISETLRQFGITKKCVAFGGDNTNTNFGGVNRGDGNVFTKLKQSVNEHVLRVGCPAHILHNCIQHGADMLAVDLELTVIKIYQYFSTYTVRTEKLKEYCEFVNITYQQLLCSTKTRWLFLYPAINRLLDMYEGLQSYFLSLPCPPKVLETFFTTKLSKAYLWHMHSLMCVFHESIQEFQNEKNSIVDVMNVLEKVCAMLKNRVECSFLSSDTLNELLRAREEGFGSEADAFVEEAIAVYKQCYEYLRKWSVSFNYYNCFHWMDLNEKVSMEDMDKCITFLRERGHILNDSQCCDQLCVLNRFLEKNRSQLATCSTNDRWVKFFQSIRPWESYSELLKLAEFFFALPAHNATLEHIFSLMGDQRTPEGNQLSVESIKGLLCVKFNFKDLTCCQFYDYLSGKPDILRKI